MTTWTWAWLFWIAMFFAIETPALFNKDTGDTLSEHVRKWFSTMDKQKWWLIRRAVLAVFLLWLVIHFFTGKL
jgi:hypothetical protein